MTEEEAKTKWCPQMYPIAQAAPTVTRCIASGCMAWRWDGTKHWAVIHKDGRQQIVAPGTTVQVPDDARTEEISDTGFCGLAGKP